MPIGTHPAHTDLLLPRPEAGQTWDAHLIHTHYFGFAVNEAAIAGFIYIRYHPAFGLCQAGVSIFRGTDNPTPLDVEYLDYEVTMPWPEVDGQTITTANGLRIEFLELGARARVTYAAADGAMSFDLIQEAVTPIFKRGHVVPGEEDHHGGAQEAGGMEQIMHVTGTLHLHGEDFAVDNYDARDRSWNQVREERRGAIETPPIGWSPMYFGEELAFNQVGIEPLDTDPAWAGLYEVDATRPAHHWGWVYVDGEARLLTSVRRNALEYHPTLHAVQRQEIEAVDEKGDTYHFTGEALAMAPVPCWPNASAVICLYRWTDAHGREGYGSYQEVAFDRYQRAMTRNARSVLS